VQILTGFERDPESGCCRGAALCSPLALGQVCDSPIHVALISTYDHLNL